MDPFTAAMISAAGTGLQIYGNYKANMDEAAAEAANESWMREQTKQIQKSTEREIGIYTRDSAAQLAAMENSFAKSGISMEGSALELKRQQEVIRMEELNAIKEQGEFNLREAYMKIGASRTKQSILTSSTNNILQASATGLRGVAEARTVYKNNK